MEVRASCHEAEEEDCVSSGEAGKRKKVSSGSELAGAGKMEGESSLVGGRIERLWSF